VGRQRTSRSRLLLKKLSTDEQRRLLLDKGRMWGQVVSLEALTTTSFAKRFGGYLHFV
jgi:hypothetical protein